MHVQDPFSGVGGADCVGREGIEIVAWEIDLEITGAVIPFEMRLLVGSIQVIVPVHDDLHLIGTAQHPGTFWEDLEIDGLQVTAVITT